MKESRKIFLLNANDSHAKLYFEWVNSASSLKNKIDTKIYKSSSNMETTSID